MLGMALGDKRRKKAGATYGKAVRRRGPAHLITTYDLSDDFQEVKIELPMRSVVSKEPEAAPATSKKRQSPSAHTDVFDFPSDSDKEVLSPASTKKRKLSPRTLKPLAKEGKQVESSRKTSPAKTRQPKAVQLSPGKPELRKSTLGTIAPLNARPIANEPAGVSQRAPPQASNGAKAKQYSTTPSKLSGDNATLSPNPNGDRRIQVPMERAMPLLGALDAGHEKEGLETSYPTSLETASETESNPRHSSPLVLSPKNAKAWKVLLGDHQETDNISSKVGKDFASKPTPPVRRRLIDTLVQQKARAKSESGSSHSTEETDTEIESSDQIATGAERISSTKAACVLPQSLVGNSVPPTAITTGARITYSRQRSMLAEQDDVLSGIDTAFHVVEPMKGGSYRSHRLAPPPLESCGFFGKEDLEDSQAPPAILSVHELRQAGASKRYTDEIDDLSDRITALSAKPSLRRSALLEILDKVQDKTFLRNLLSSGAEQKILATMAEETDEISGLLLGSLLLLLLDPSTSKLSSNQLGGLGFVKFCRRFLKKSDSIVSIAKQRKTNMSKMATAAIEDRQRKLLDLPLWGDVRPNSLSPRTVVLACLALALSPRAGQSSSHALVPEDLVRELFSVLTSCATRPLASKDETLQCNLLLLVSILGHVYLPHSENPDQPHWGPEYLSSICCIATKLLAIDGAQMASLQRVVLSLILNITNNNSHATAIFATREFMTTILRSVAIEFEILADAASEDARMASLDALVLMLGIMINLVEKLNDETSHILEGSDLMAALQIFSAHAEKSFEADSVEDTHFNVVFGYLAVLLGYLSLMGHLTVPIRTNLHGKSLGTLIDAINEFIRHHQQVDALSDSQAHNYNAHTALTDRLSRMLKRVSKIEAHLTQ